MEVKAGYKLTDVGVIPEDWQVRTIGKVFSLVNGRAFKPEEWKSSGTPIIRIQNLNDPAAPFNYTTSTVAEKHSVREGDLLFAWSGTLGTSFGARIWRGADGVLNQHIFKVHGNAETVAPQFSLRVFKKIEDDIAKQAHGFKTSFVHVKKSDLTKVSLPVPPLHEQNAIANALNDVDELITSLDQLIAKKRDLKQAAMQQLLTGKTRLQGFSGEWETKKLREVVKEIKDGATPSTNVNENFGGSIKWVVIEDIVDHIISTKTTLTETGLKSCAARLWPKGSLIVSTGATIGEVGIAGTNLATKQGICGIVFDDLVVSTLFMKCWFQNNKSKIQSLAQGSTIKEVRPPELLKLELSIPSLAEQKEISETLTAFDDELIELEQRRDKTIALKQGMMQELLTGRTRLV